MNTNEKTAGGEIVISNDVIASIALNAAKDVEGVSAFVPKTPDLISRLRKSECGEKAVRVFNLDGSVRIRIYLRVKSGTNIQTVSSAVQRSVKNAVQSMTGKVVGEVNVSVQGIDFDAATTARA